MEVMEANQVPKVSLGPEETPVSPACQGPVWMAPGGRMVFLVFPERRASPERYWGPLQELPEPTASLGPLETRASPGLLGGLADLVRTGVVVLPG